MIGRLKQFHPAVTGPDGRKRGFYGFIRIDGGRSFFFHGKDAQDPDRLRLGDEVEFLLTDGRVDGELIATAVRRKMDATV
jgi:cold shock CspA family protein